MRDAGKLFRVSERTIRNWEAGRVGIPYTAFKLMRILRGYELPGQAWKGYRLKGDTLWSPEGKAFRASDATWWSLTCAMANEFTRQYRHRAQAPELAAGQSATSPESGEAAVLVHYSTSGTRPQNAAPARARPGALVEPRSFRFALPSAGQASGGLVGAETAQAVPA